jgi:hypothetical protein
MRRGQREKSRREINDEILPSLRIEQVIGDFDATSRQKLTRLKTNVPLCGLDRWLFHGIVEVAFSDPERSIIPREKKSGEKNEPKHHESERTTGHAHCRTAEQSREREGSKKCGICYLNSLLSGEPNNSGLRPDFF